MINSDEPIINQKPQISNNKLPTYKKISDNCFSLKISSTQLRKRTINANQLVRDIFKNSNLIDFSEIKPGEKKILHCRFIFKKEHINSRASFLIPKRRGLTSPEARFWPYKLNKYVEQNMILYFIVNNESSPYLEVHDKIPGNY